MIRQITNQLCEISLGMVNAHLLRYGSELILIDTGSPGDAVKIAAALKELGHTPADLTHILITHCHADHAGGLAGLQELSPAITFMHHLDAAAVRQGKAMRPLYPAPGRLNRLLFRRFIAPSPPTIQPGRIDQLVEDEELLPLAGGMRIIHAPGHSAGQVALLWEPAGVLFAADAVTNLPWLNYSLGYEDFQLGRQTAARLSCLTFAIACFGHGQALRHQAQPRFQKQFTLPEKNHA